MRALFFVIALAAGLTSLPAGAAWPPLSDVYAQGPKGRDGGERPERAQGAPGGQATQGAQPPRDARPDRRPEQAERRERLNEDERKALHRDLDKANREIYQRPSPQ